MKKLAFLTLTLFSMIGAQAYAQSDEQKVIIRLNMKEANMHIQQIPSIVDIAGQDLRGGTLDLVGSFAYFNLLKEQGYPVELVQMQPAKLDERYLRPEEILTLVQELQTRYPELVKVKEIGKSILGRPILGVRISTQENIGMKPTILFNGMHHAREIMTTEVTADIMIYLTKNFDNPETPWVAQWLQNMAIWVIPQVNPDGNQIVWTQDNWWRKNAHADSRGMYGVDINRNYPYSWNSCGGSSGSRSDQTFRGASGGSEPETQAIMGLVKSENIAMSISYHSYSELVIAPYGCKGSLTPENFIVEKVGKEFASKLVKDNEKSTYDYGTGWQLLYPVDGDDIGWMYNEVNTLAYVVEVNSSSQGFQPDYEKWRNNTVLKQRPGWQYLLNRLMGGSQVRGRILDASTGKPIEGNVKIAGINYKDEKPRTSNQFGIYQKIMNPGSYELVYSANGYKPQHITVNVDEQGITLQDALLERGASIELED